MECSPGIHKASGPSIRPGIEMQSQHWRVKEGGPKFKMMSYQHSELKTIPGINLGPAHAHNTHTPHIYENGRSGESIMAESYANTRLINWKTDVDTATKGHLTPSQLKCLP